MDEQTAFHRVDAARRLMTVPGKGAEASGRLHFAKRVHEATKAGAVDDATLDHVLADLENQLSPAARDGARKEHAWMKAHGAPGN